MPDLSMCDNDKCSKRKQCYRFCAVPFKEWQCWTHFELEEYQGGCFLPNRPGDKLSALGNAETNEAE